MRGSNPSASTKHNRAVGYKVRTAVELAAVGQPYMGYVKPLKIQGRCDEMVSQEIVNLPLQKHLGSSPRRPTKFRGN